MSSTISSTEQVATSTLYEWVDTANRSPSRKTENGVLTGINVVSDPDTTSTATWAPTNGTGSIVGGKLRMTPGGSATPYVYPSPHLSVAQFNRFAARPGERWTMRVELTNPNASATLWYAIGCAFYNAIGGGSGASSQITARTALAPGQTVTAEMSGIVPDNGTTPTEGLLPLVYLYNAANGQVAPSTLLLDMTRWQVEIGGRAPRQTPFRYFSGSTPNDVVQAPAIARPLQVLGYESQRASANVFHDVIGRANPDVTLRPAGLRTGTLTYLFGSEVDALECERMHSGTGVLTLDDPDLPTIAMPYVADGAITRQLDSETRRLWLVGVAYREVRA